MTATLEMPATYTDIVDADLDELDGGAVPVLGIIAAVIAGGGAVYTMGQVAGERAYYAGLRNPEWQRVKWSARGTAVGLLGVVGGGIFMLGFENKFYSMI